MQEPGMREVVVSFVADLMKKNPDLSMGDAQKAAGKKHNIYPLIMGLARKKLGMSKAKAPKSGRGPGRPPGSLNRGPGRPAGSGNRGRPRKGISESATMLQGIIGHVQELESEVARLRNALAQIGQLAGGG